MRLVDEFDELRGAADVSMTEIKGELTTITKSLAVVQVRSVNTERDESRYDRYDRYEGREENGDTEKQRTEKGRERKIHTFR